ncbi:MAG: Asp-tRNA(Asn)/Glu-tRNA(Gln) amidotransferase subunit GatC [Geminocystis sp.]|nr:Asp-tRNA(Asn)/Glu-tRNA(Gln) amidotransferase subunit GatC [Geminocystis sp.]HIK37152.1 Asp-tRNA(Asn)/Glu-tRNA(Gln) amidotransferase subunit GatC [Geminocystis sp. M7585_C2015_104]MCS7147478.1 Asp-tRNA(Asn)/Glu-tRNA(Gln) amidotransferase subunit GatC [Geminocystis sp.]MCX8077881.1 Asp-tRNA(Asn)/Glu-tRNA(Gln) amidotransferase subunit GatC [Geminocystis sp.]MDW8115171.1 Asp-tRNA(Asn)/Glu-tRNA(Gln) amidotransferase subunit GatC [Geminocystis sp.]
MSLSEAEVRKVANLARLQLTEAEEKQFARQLSDILDYFQQLQELDTEGVEPTTRAIEVSNVTREDLHIPYGNREELLNLAPIREDEFFQVPKILT